MYLLETLTNNFLGWRWLFLLLSSITLWGVLRLLLLLLLLLELRVFHISLFCWFSNSSLLKKAYKNRLSVLATLLHLRNVCCKIFFFRSFSTFLLASFTTQNCSFSRMFFFDGIVCFLIFGDSFNYSVLSFRVMDGKKITPKSF